MVRPESFTSSMLLLPKHSTVPEDFSMNKPDQTDNHTSRRDFLKTSTAALTGGIAASLGVVPAVHAAGSDEIRVGLIGCGERGTGASQNVLESSPGVKLVAMGDVFKDHIEKSLANLEKFGDKIDVPEERRFIGFDAYERVLASDANYI